MTAPYRQQFVNHKVDVALALAEGECGGAYSDALILISSAVSGIAADLWPGERIDQRRFIETWVKFVDPSLLATRISIPMLREDLRAANKIGEAAAIEQARPKMFGPGYGSKVVIDFDIDASESEVRALCPTLTLAEIRRFAYPSVFYRDVRSPLVHEYHLGDRASHEAMTERDAGVSYVNLMGAQRLVYYHLDWLSEVVRSIAASTSTTAGPLPPPARWWIEG